VGGDDLQAVRRGPELVELTPFVGREEERTWLREIIDSTQGGAGGLVMIGGEPGVGKSRLAQQMAREGRDRGFRVFTGHCYEREGDLPYMPWVEIIEAAAQETPPEAFREVLADSAPEMARIAPQLRLILPDIPPPLQLPAEQQRRYTFGCIADYVGKVARIQPRLYVVEDLHWADESTLLFLSYLAERLGSIPALVIGTYRDPPLDISPLLAETLSVLVRNHRARLIGLRRHPENEVTALLEALGGEPPPAGVVAAIYAETEGNAFFVEEMFRHLAESGSLFDEEGRFRADLRVAEFDVPHNVRLVTGRRLDRLSEPTRRMLTAAAVVGRRCGLQVLDRVVDLGDAELLDAVDEAEQARLVLTELKGGEVHLWFAHELIRQTLLTRLSPARRQRHHLRVAVALEQVYARHPEVGAADIAHHLLQAGPSADALTTATYLRMAGDHALTAAAFEEAIRYFEGALDLLPEDSLGERAVALEKAGRALSSLGRPDEAMASWRQALDGYRALGEVDKLARLCCQVAWQLLWLGQAAQAVEMAERELEVLGRVESCERAQLLAIAAQGMSWEDFEAGYAMMVEGLELARRLGDRGVEGIVLSSVSNIYWAHARFRDAVEAGHRAALLLREAGAIWHYTDTLGFTQLSVHALGRWDEAERLDLEVEQLAGRIGQLGALLIGRRERGGRERNRGADLRHYEEFAKADLELNRSAGMPWIAHSYLYFALLAFWRGDWESALRHIERACELEPPPPSVMSLWSPALRLLLTAYARGGDETLAMFHGLERQLPEPGGTHPIGAWQLLTCAVEALVVIGALGGAAALHPVIVEHIDSGVVVDGYNHGRLLQMVAGIAAAAGGLECAEWHFEEALRQAKRLGQQMEDLDIRRFYAAMLIERGGAEDRKRARALLGEAIAGYRTIGMPRHQKLAEVLAATVGLQSDPGEAPDALTARESQVLRLVAKGHRNSEIAAELFLSAATVQRHVSNIYAKVGVRNRAEATAYALKQGLSAKRTM
jgi:ATP/maltotriose-dependent transcriptional regulator MalT